MSLPDGYAIRPATPEDADVIAVQRGEMFVDMGNLTPLNAEEQRPLWADWLGHAIPAGEYTGLLVQHGPEIVGGVGMMFHPKMPSASDPTTRKAYIMNMHVAPEHRRQGLAEALMQAALAETRQRGLKSVSLHAAPMGKRIYERLGFVEATNPEMRLTLKEQP